MAKENKSKYAVLGVLSRCPGSGYDIKKFMEQSTSNFWNEKGQQELARWLNESIEYAVERNELLLKLFFGRHTSPAKNIEHVQEFQALQSQLLKKYEGIERYLQAGVPTNPDFSYSLMTVRFGIHRCRALLAWSAETLAALQALTD
ncbi:MAG: PadR family transcriptional regulator [Chloroflexota bacterium]|nr:MAG: PadR family transcriptional regulator [Chloroflexota bacterium]